MPRSLALLANLNVFYGGLCGLFVILLVAAFTLWGASILRSLLRGGLLLHASHFTGVVLFFGAYYGALAVGHFYAGLRLREFQRRARLVAMVVAAAHIPLFLDRVAGLTREHDGPGMFWALVQLVYIVFTFAILTRADMAARFDGGRLPARNGVHSGP